MRVFETHVQELKNDVLRSVAKLAWADDLQTGILDIPEQLIPGPVQGTDTGIRLESEGRTPRSMGIL